MDYDTVIKKYYEIDKEKMKYEQEHGAEKGTINVLAKDLKILKDSYKEHFGFEADENTLLFGRKVIEIKL